MPFLIIKVRVFTLPLLGLAVITLVYFFLWVIKNTPPLVRKISFLSLTIGILAIEIFLRMNGAVPGLTTSFEESCPGITIMPIDSLVENQIMVCDSAGINKFNRSNTLPSIQPLNSDGFRSPYEFSQATIDSHHARGKKAIFFIGDSWTYGLNADSGYSFASILDRSEKYTILNAGIPGTDLPQYKTIVKEYILSGKLKPDKVVICISRNDLQHIPDRKLTPGILLQFCTNAGAFHSYFSDQDTVVGGARDTYRYILDRYTIIGILGEGWRANIIGKSVVASRLLGWLVKSPFIHNTFFSSLKIEQNQSNRYIELKDPTEGNIQEIKNDCEGVNIPVAFILLPSKFCAGEKTAPKFKNVISLNNNVVPSCDYPVGQDDHPNNAGHYKLFVAIKKILDSGEQQE